jgi:hypothetical protein
MIETKYYISRERAIFRIWTNSEFFCEYKTIDDKTITTNDSSDIDLDEFSINDHKVFLSGWSQRLRLIAAVMGDGSIVLLQSFQCGYHATARIHPVMLLQTPKSKKPIKSSSVADDLDSDIFNQKENPKIDTLKEVISRVLMCRLVDSYEINEPDSALLVTLVMTRHLPSMSENEDALVARSSISLIISKINFIVDIRVPDGNGKKAVLNHVACMRIKENIDPVETYTPYIEITSISNHPALILTIGDSISCHPLHDIRSTVFRIGISYGLPDINSSMTGAEEKDMNVNTRISRYATTLVCMGKLIISTVICQKEEELFFYDSQIHSTPLIEFVNSPTLCQTDNLLLDHSQGCIYIHSLSSNPFRNFSKARKGKTVITIQ